MPVFNIHHVTKYEYDRPVKESVNEIRIYPFSGPDQEVLFHELNVTDHPDILQVNDYWGNKAGMFNVLTAHKLMVIESKLIVRTLRSTEIPSSMAGFDALRSEVSDNLTLLELSFCQEADIRDQISELAKEIHVPSKPVAENVGRDPRTQIRRLPGFCPCNA
jgi:hypothetical protein